MRDKSLKIVVAVGIICIVSILVIVNINRFMGNKKQVVSSNAIKGGFNQAVTIGNRLLAESNGEIVCYEKDGNRQWSKEIGFKNPKLIKANNNAVVADINGSTFKQFSDLGITYERTVKGTIINLKANKNGYLAILYKDSNNKSMLQFYNNQGKIIFSDKFYKGVLLDAGISDDNNKYFAVIQDVIGEGLIYQVINYDKHGEQSDVNMIKGEVYIGGHYINDKLVFCDTAKIHCIFNGKELWQKQIDGSLSKVFDTNDYFAYESVPKGTILSNKYYIKVIDSDGNVKLDKNIDNDINSIQTYEKGIIASGERELKYINISGKEIWDYPTYKDIKLSAFDGDNGYIVFVKDALYVKLGTK